MWRDDLEIIIGGVNLKKLTIPGDLPTPEYSKEVESIFMKSGENEAGLRVLNDRGFHVSYQDFNFVAGYVTTVQKLALELLYSTPRNAFQVS